VCYKEHTQVYLAKPLVSRAGPGATSQMAIILAPALNFWLSSGSCFFIWAPAPGKMPSSGSATLLETPLKQHCTYYNNLLPFANNIGLYSLSCVASSLFAGVYKNINLHNILSLRISLCTQLGYLRKLRRGQVFFFNFFAGSKLKGLIVKQLLRHQPS